MWPPVPIERKVSVKDDTLPDGTFIPQGTIIAWSNYALGRMKEYWDEPEKFIPERWENKNHAPGFYPFLFGPRICLGQQMAYLEASVALVKLLPIFKFTHTREAEMDRSITLRVADGMPMKISKRI